MQIHTHKLVLPNALAKSMILLPINKIERVYNNALFLFMDTQLAPTDA